MAEITNNVKEV